MAKQKPLHSKKAETLHKPAKTSKGFSFAKYADWGHILIITVLFWLVYTSIFEKKPDLNGDNFAYYLLGKRLATGQGFTNATDIHHQPHTHFPPGYPFLLALFMKTVGDDQDTLNYMNGMMMYGSLLLLYFMAKRITSSSSLAFAVAFITALNAHLLRSSTITMSEIPFLFESLLALFFFVRAIDDPKGIKSPWLYLSVVFVAACYYTKTTAIALIAGMGLYLLFSREWLRLGVVMAEFALLYLPWYIRGMHLKSSHMGQLMQVNPYKPELGNLTTATFIERVENNFVRYLSVDIPSGVLSLEVNFEKAPISFWLTGIAIIALVLWGMYKLRDFRLLFLGYFAGTFAILLVWPDVWGGIRFIMPLIPLAIFFSLYAVKELIALALKKNNSPLLPYSFLLLGLIYQKPIGALEEQAAQPMPQNYVNYFEAAKWAKNNTPKDAIFSARKADMFIYYADRTCIGDKPSLDDKEVLDFFRQNNVDYVVVEQLGFSSTAKYLIPAIQKNPDKFDMVLHLQNPDTYVLKFKK